MSATGVTATVVATNTWFQPDDGNSYMGMINQLVQTPNCGFAYSYVLFYKPDSSGTLYQPPSEVILDAANGMIYVEKCNKNAAQDATCIQTPYSKTFPLVLRVFLDNGKIGTPQQQMVELSLTAKIVDPCITNKVWLENTVSHIDYSLEFPSLSYKYAPRMKQDISTCLVQCNLFANTGSSFIDYTTSGVVQSFS